MNIFQRLIHWAFYKYVDTPIIDLSGYEIEFVDEEEQLIAELEEYSQQLKELLNPTFDNEIDRAMYERKFFTLH